MPDFLGIDTSNYTTSSAIFRGDSVVQNRRLLPVKAGQLGLRQSDAVFEHVRRLPEILDRLPFADSEILAVGVSDKPRNEPGSYMPCFLAGVAAADAAARSLKVPLFRFSHQQGHIAAALYSVSRLDLLKERYLAFHVSGGTTEAVLAEPDPEAVFRTRIVARSLDLKAGQAIDRTGAMLGLPFPAGRELEKLALSWHGSFHIRPCLKGADCSLSGIENKCHSLMEQGSPKEEIAAFCLRSILAALDGMTDGLLKQFGRLPVVFAGGVASDSILREELSGKYGAVFAEPEFSGDNAAGIAVLAAVKKGMLS